MNCSSLRIAMVLTTVVILSHLALAQTGTGSVNGTVTDSSGSAVPGATVNLTNVGTKIADQAKTNTAGYFVFINVRPGSYLLNVESQGFKKAQVPQFALDVNQTMTENLSLELGS